MLTAMAWLSAVMSPKLDELGDALQQPEVWEQFWLQWPHQWSSILMQALKRDAAAVQQMAALRVETSGGEDADEQRDAGHVCEQCNRAFTTHKALCANQQKVHGRRRAVRSLLWGTVCPWCLREFHTVSRAMGHLERGK